MNKYQQALNNCVNRWAPTKDWNLLKALVEKATPKKPYDKGDYYICPNCSNDKCVCGKFCPNCGQALDWGMGNDE